MFTPTLLFGDESLCHSSTTAVAHYAVTPEVPSAMFELGQGPLISRNGADPVSEAPRRSNLRRSPQPRPGVSGEKQRQKTDDATRGVTVGSIRGGQWWTSIRGDGRENRPNPNASSVNPQIHLYKLLLALCRKSVLCSRRLDSWHLYAMVYVIKIY